VCRTEKSLSAELRRKVALFCNVNVNAVIESIDADTIYDVPLLMYKEQLDKVVLNKLKLPLKHEPELDAWKIFLGKLKNPVNEVRIGLVGKYVELKDAYKSIVEAFIHGGVANECKVRLEWIHSEKIDAENVAGKLASSIIRKLPPGRMTLRICLMISSGKCGTMPHNTWPSTPDRSEGRIPYALIGQFPKVLLVHDVA